MHLLTANPIKQMIAAVLAVSLSVCCCQTHFLFHGLSGGDLRAELIEAPTTPSCCDGCADDGDAPAEDGGSRGPQKGCQTCCIKGSGMKDAGSLVPAADAMPAPAFLLPAVVELGVPVATSLRPAGNAASLRIEPPTLLRLRCALIV